MKARLARRPAGTAGVQRSATAAPRVRAPAPPQPGLRWVPGGLDVGTVLRLQASAGNQAVGELLGGPRLSVQAQPVACPAPAAAPPPVSPHADPKFIAVTGRVKQEAGRQKDHPPATAKVAEAQDAAAGPSNEVASKAAASQVVDDMSQRKPRGFDRAAFVRAVHEAIEKATPKTMEEVDDMARSDRAAAVKGEVGGKVVASKDAAARDIADASSAPPDPSRATARPVTPMGPETPGRPPADVRAGEAMPSAKPAEQVSLDHTRCETDAQMAEAGVTGEQVESSNEPEFHQAMDAKKQADDHARSAPQQLRQDEQHALGQARGDAGASAASGLTAMHQTRATAAGHVGTHKDEAKARNETERANLATELEGIYNATKKDVGDTLGGLDKKVSDRFDAGERAARDAFNKHVKTKKDEYFDKRYGQAGGSLLWIADKLTSPPPEVNRFIDEAKQLYVSEMEGAINDVATVVETELNRATARIQEGRQQIKERVAAAPKALQRYAREAAGQFESRFDELDQAVESRSSGIIDDLAQKYVAASKAVDDLCQQMHEANKGLLDKAKDAVGGMVETIEKMKAMLANMAARARDVADRIIDKPIDFLHNLIAAVKQGFGQFVDKIGAYLKKGLMQWLFGEVAKAGITLPDKFDLRGILMLLAQVLGLTWANIRSRAVKILGARVMAMLDRGAAAVQKGIEIYNTIKNEGLAGVWHLVQDRVAEIKAQIMESVGTMVVEEVVKAGVKWVLGLLNPASAFVKACMAIYDIVMFFVNHGREIADLVNAVIDNLGAIVAGNVGAAANMVEQALARAVPIAIGFLASLLGLGDLGSKIKAILDKVQEPVGQAVDWVLGTVIKPAIGLVAKGVNWVKGKARAGVAWVKAKAKAGVDYVKAKARAGVEKLKAKFGRKKDEPKAAADQRSVEQKQADLDAAMGAGYEAVDDANASDRDVKRRLAALKFTHRLTRLSLVVDGEDASGGTVHIEGAVNPTQSGPHRKRKLSSRQQLERLRKFLQDQARESHPVLQQISLTNALAEQILKGGSVEEVATRLNKSRRQSRSRDSAQPSGRGPVRPYGDAPKPGDTGYRRGYQWHHPEMQSAMKEGIIGYNYLDDPTLRLTERQHRLTFAWQPRRGTPEWADMMAAVGSAASIEDAADISARALAGGRRPTSEQQSIAATAALEHAAYMFGITPLGDVQQAIAAHEEFQRRLVAAAQALVAYVAQLKA